MMIWFENENLYIFDIFISSNSNNIKYNGKISWVATTSSSKKI